MPSEVFFTKFGATHFNDSIIDRLTKMFDRAGGGSIIKENETVAVKAHFGEPGNVSFVSPVYYRAVIDRIRLCGGNPFLTDTNTLYVGERNNAAKHLTAAIRHGFSYSTVNAPVIIADGLLGTDFVEVEIPGTRIKKARIGSAIYWADAMVVISHVKGHMMTGMGAALKNLGMGCACRAGKQEQHSGANPKVDKNKCTGCSECVDWCNFRAISMNDKKAGIDPGKCSGCGECIGVCRFDAISSNWDTDLTAMQEKMAEYALAAVANKKKKVLYINFLMNITPECDCMPSSDNYLVPDIGILASFDPVAIDQASADLVNKAPVIKENTAHKKDYDMSHSGTDKWRMVHPSLDFNLQLAHAEKIGLGSRKYELLDFK